MKKINTNTTNSKRVELKAMYDARASFYGKAKILKGYFEGYPGFWLESYETKVAFAYVTYGLGECNYGCAYHVIDPCSKKEIDVKHPGWSQTTNRHIREFYKQFMNHDITVSNYGYMDDYDESGDDGLGDGEGAYFNA